MITFDSYSPQTWLDRCLIVRPDIKKTHMSKPQKRTGRWSSVLSVGVVTASLFVSTVELPHTPIGIADTGVFARKIDRGLFGPDDHFVPQGYWERLGAAIKLANRLPDQEISKDPPVMV